MQAPRPHQSRRPLRLLALGLLVLALASCAAEEEGAPVSDWPERPTMSFTGAVYTLGRPEFRPVTLRARSLELYDDRSLAVLEGVEFDQKDENGEVVMEGSCERAEVDTKSYDARLGGKVRIRLPQERFSIDGEDMAWDHEDQRISTDKEALLLYDSGSGLRGRGFTFDFRNTRCEFDEIIEGRLEP